MLLRDRTLHRLAALRAAVPKSAEEEQKRKEAATTRSGDDGPVIEAPPGAAVGSAELLAAPAAPTLALRITLGTARRAAASGTGARPKASIDGPAAEERRKRQEEERQRERFEELQMQARPKNVSSWRLVDGDAAEKSVSRERSKLPRHGRADMDESPERREEWEEEDVEETVWDEESIEGRRRARLEEKRKREEWRKAWKQEKRRKEEEEQRKRQAKLREEERSRRERGEQQDEDSDLDDPRKRAKMWGALNRDVRTILPKTTIQGGKSPGQISDADLDLRLRSRLAGSVSEKLMSEAEVVAKLQRDRGR